MVARHARARIEPTWRRPAVLALSRNLRLDHPSVGKANDVADDRIELDVGFFEGLTANPYTIDP